MNTVVNNNQVSFCGARQGRQFRRAANKVIKQMSASDMTFDTFSRKPGKGQPSMRNRFHLIADCKFFDIGLDHITAEDRRLKKQLSGLYSKLFLSSSK